jgi:hypothetical protein
MLLVRTRNTIGTHQHVTSSAKHTTKLTFVNLAPNISWLHYILQCIWKANILTISWIWKTIIICDGLFSISTASTNTKNLWTLWSHNGPPDDLISRISCSIDVCTFKCIFLHLSHMKVWHWRHVHLISVVASQSSQVFGVCARRRDWECCMFCRTCDVLVCSNCISCSHKKHYLESIDQVCMETIEQLKVIRDMAWNIVRADNCWLNVYEASRWLDIKNVMLYWCLHF